MDWGGGFVGGNAMRKSVLLLFFFSRRNERDQICGG